MARITSAPAGNVLEMSRGTESRTFRTMSVMTLKMFMVFGDGDDAPRDTVLDMYAGRF